QPDRAAGGAEEPGDAPSRTAATYTGDHRTRRGSDGGAGAIARSATRRCAYRRYRPRTRAAGAHCQHQAFLCRRRPVTRTFRACVTTPSAPMASINAYYFRVCTEGARRQGADVPALLRAAGIEPQQIEDPLWRGSAEAMALLVRGIWRT